MDFFDILNLRFTLLDICIVVTFFISKRSGFYFAYFCKTII